MKSCLCVGDVSVKWNKSSAWLTVHMELNWHLLFINMHISSPIFSDLLIVAYWRRMQHRSGKTLAHVMACCLTAPSHYLNQCWFIIRGFLWNWPESNCTRSAYERMFGDYTLKSLPQLLGTNELTLWPQDEMCEFANSFLKMHFFFNENDCVSNFPQAWIQGTVCLAPSHNPHELNTKDDLMHCSIVCVTRPQCIFHTHV